MSRKVPPVHYTIGPVLSSKAPIGRSRFLVFAVALGFLGLAGRAAYIQVWKQDFFVQKGEVRYAIEWPGLSAEEKAEGCVLPCVAYPASDVRLQAQSI